MSIGKKIASCFIRSFVLYCEKWLSHTPATGAALFFIAAGCSLADGTEGFAQGAILSNNLSNLSRSHDELRTDFRAFANKSDEKFSLLLDRMAKSDATSAERATTQMAYTNKLLAFQVAQFFIFALVIVTLFFYFSSAVAAVAAGAGK